MRRSRIAGLIAVGTISLPLLASTASAVAASPRAAPSIGTQLAELKGSDTGGTNHFGNSVAISGTTVVVGTSGPDEPGAAAYVFTRAAVGWKQAAELKGSDTVADDSFGYSVAISGTTVVVGAPMLAGPNRGGRAYVFTRTGAGWKQAAELKGSDTVGWDQFGNSVAISGTTVVVGAPMLAGPNRGGRAYVFMKTGLGWKQAAELKGNDTVGSNFKSFGDGFGNSVAISGTTVVVGAGLHANGRAYVFTRTATGWRQVAELAGVAADLFGDSVAISGTTVVVGAPFSASYAGRAFVFTKIAAGWTQAAELKGGDTSDFGSSVAISGNTVVVGDDFQSRAHLFTRATGWKQVDELKGSDSGAADKFGTSVAISGTTVVVGAPMLPGANRGGRAYIFEA
jgi:ribosomal protein S6E (S10)